MHSVSPEDLGLALAVDTVADVLADLTETAPGRNYEPGADLTASPAVGIEPSAPWCQFRHVGRSMVVSWRMRLIVGRWEAGAQLNLAARAYALAASPLRLAGFDVGALEAPAVATIAGQPYLAAAFPVALVIKET
jgi:hypothetical protein